MVETIGFIISLIALFFLFIKQKAATMQKRNSSDYLDEEEAYDPFKEFFKSIENEEESRTKIQQKPPHPPKKKASPKKALSHPKEEYRVAKSLDKRQLKGDNHPIKPRVLYEEIPGRIQVHSMHHLDEENVEPKISRLQSAVERLHHRRDLLIYQEIMKKPKSLRSETPFYDY